MGGALLSARTGDLRERLVGLDDEGMDVREARFAHDVAHAAAKCLAAAVFQRARGHVPARRQFRNAQVEAARRADFLQQAYDERVVRLRVGGRGARRDGKGRIQDLSAGWHPPPHQAVKQVRCAVAGFFGVKRDGRERWQARLAERRVVVDAQKGESVGNGNASLLAGISDLPSACIVRREDGDGLG